MKAAFAIAFFCLPFLYANPQRPQVIEGSASFHELSDTHLQIRTDNKAIIEWSDFSIHSGEITQFVQPGIGSVALNRVLDAAPSQLLGRLESNGQVYLINPNGVFVGKDAYIDTASFIASTLDVQNRAFMAGEPLVFSGSSTALVINEGMITGRNGDVMLIGFEVENHGQIESNDGMTGLIAAREVLVRPEGAARIFVKSVRLDENAYSSSFTHPGEEDALEMQDGVLFIGNPKVTHTGEISSKYSHEKGGDVCLLGDWIEVSGHAVIDTSQKFGGGNVLIGGDYQGNNPEILNAEKTYIGHEASIFASALEDGNGGRVIVWADGYTSFWGNVYAEGGNSRGDGGLVEVSGHENLIYRGKVSTQALFGSQGTLLLDPLNIRVSAAVSNAAVTGPPPPFALAFPNNVGANLSVADLAASLAVNDVTIRTTGTVGPESGDIRLTGDALFASPNALTLISAGDVLVIRRFENSGGGALNVQAGRDFVIDASVGSVPATFTTTGPIDVDVGRDMLFQGGFVPLSGASLGDSFPGGVESSSVNVNVVGNLTMEGGAGGGGTQIGPGSISGTVVVQAGGDINLNASGAAVSGNLIIAGGPGSTLNVFSGGNIELNGPGLSSSAMTGSETLVVEAVGSITLNSNVGSPGATFFSLNDVLVIAGTDLVMTGSSRISFLLPNSSITIVVDNQFPVPPGRGSGAFRMGPDAFLTGVGFNPTRLIRIFTSEQQRNSIQGTINTASFSPGPIYVNSATEQWGTYFPSLFGGSPFTIFYKDSLQIVAQQAALVVSDFLRFESSFNYDLGWPEEFYIRLSSAPLPKYENSKHVKNVFDDKGNGYIDRYRVLRPDGGRINNPKSYRVTLE